MRGMVHIMVRLVFSCCSLMVWPDILLVAMDTLDMTTLRPVDTMTSRKAPMVFQVGSVQIFQVGMVVRSTPRKEKFITNTLTPSPS